MLERRDERELDALALFVAGVGPGEAVLDRQLLVGIRVNPDRLDKRRRGSVARRRSGPVLGSEDAARPSLDRVEARARRVDRIRR